MSYLIEDPSSVREDTECQEHPKYWRKEISIYTGILISISEILIRRKLYRIEDFLLYVASRVSYYRRFPDALGIFGHQKLWFLAARLPPVFGERCHRIFQFWLLNLSLVSTRLSGQDFPATSHGKLRAHRQVF